MTHFAPSPYQELSFTVPSIYLAEDRSIRVFLPPGFSADKRYPVIYVQDGQDYFDQGQLSARLSDAIAQDTLVPAIAVGVEANTANRRAEYAPEGDRNEQYRNFWNEELVPWVESRYPVSTQPEGRLLAGSSFGATLSLQLALNNPELYRSIAALSGAYYPPIQEQLKKHADLSWLRLYMSIGEEETAHPTPRGEVNFLELNRTAKEMLEQRNAAVTYKEKPGTHAWSSWQDELIPSLRHFLGN